MSRVPRTVSRLAAAAICVTLALGVRATLADDGQEGATIGSSAANTAVLLGTVTAEGIKKIANPGLVKKEVRPATGQPGSPVLPEEIELVSDIAVRLLSGNVTKLLADAYAGLFSDNSTALFSGNEPSLLSDNTTELLSGNETQLFSGNEPELLSGNKIQLFSNITVKIELDSSGNNNTSGAGGVAADNPKKRGKFGALDGNRNGTVSLREYSGSKTGKKSRRARERFGALDANGDGLLTIEEFTGQSTGHRSVALEGSR